MPDNQTLPPKSPDPDHVGCFGMAVFIVFCVVVTFLVKWYLAGK